jgi:hypothetical protein
MINAMPDPHDPVSEPVESRRDLPPAAKRAKAEAEARRKAYVEQEAALPKELGGRKQGLEPGRYGDWEHKGLTSDF